MTAKTAWILLGIDLAKVLQNLGDILLTQISFTLVINSSLLEQVKSSRQSFMKFQAFSIGLRSGELPGHGIRGMLLVVRKAFTDLAVW